MVNKIRTIFQSFKQNVRKGYRATESTIERRPLLSFFSTLGVLLILIIFSNVIHAPKTESTGATSEPKRVEIYKIGTVPKMSAQAQIEKTGVITITALMPGVINEINVYEGENVDRGANLIWMTNNYQGGNIYSVQRQLAQVQLKNVQDTYDIQKDIIAKQRELAEKSKSNTDELREITEDSIDETKSLIDLNEKIVDSLTDNIENYESSNVNGSNDALILTTRQILSQVLAGLNGARTALRQTEYQVNTEKPPTKLSELQKDITLRQLNLQEHALNVSVEVSRMQLQIAQITEASMHPVAPAAGIIQKVHVRLGEAVNPGTPLITLAGNSGQLNAVAYVPQSVSQNISKIEPSFLYFGSRKISAFPVFISDEAVQGSLYAVKFAIPSEYYSSLTDDSFIRVEIPIGYADTTASIPFIPIDSVYQNKTAAYIFVNEKGKAKSRELMLGSVFGQFVQVESGLRAGDRVIVNRNIIEGDPVSED